MNDFFYNIYGLGVSLQVSQPMHSYFDRTYSPFKSSKLSSERINIRIIECFTKPFPLRIKGSHYGFNFKQTRLGSNPQVEIYFNSECTGKDLARIVDFTRFLFYWTDKSQAHAAGVYKNEIGAVFFAPCNTGKTTIALKLVKKGWSLIGDDWIIYDNNGKAYLYPQPIRIHDYNLADNLPWTRFLYGSVFGYFMHYYMKIRLFTRLSIISRIPSRGLRFILSWILNRPILEQPVSDFSVESYIPSNIKYAFWLERHDNIEKSA